MRQETTGASAAIGQSLIAATYATVITDTIVGFFEYLAMIRRSRAGEQARLRERHEAQRIVEKLPCEIQSDIAWRERGERCLHR